MKNYVLLNLDTLCCTTPDCLHPLIKQKLMGTRVQAVDSQDPKLIPQHPQGHNTEGFNWEDFLLNLEYFIVSCVYVGTRHVACGREAERDD